MTVLSGKSGRIKIGASASVTGATAGSGSVVVTSALSVEVGDVVLISGVVGMTDLNNSGKGHIVTAKGTGTFTVPVSTSQTYTSGGTAQKILPITDWSLSVSSQTANVTNSESGEWEEHIISGHKNWSGKYSAIMPDTGNQPPVAQSLAIQLDVDATNGWSGTAIFEGFEVQTKVPGADAVQISGTFKGTGALTQS